jgi:hypothetical protein
MSCPRYWNGELAAEDGEGWSDAGLEDMGLVSKRYTSGWRKEHGFRCGRTAHSLMSLGLPGSQGKRAARCHPLVAVAGIVLNVQP